MSPPPALRQTHPSPPVDDAPDWDRLLADPKAETSGSRRLVWAATAAAHLLALWAVLQVSEVREALRQAAPMVVDLITPEPAPEPKPPAPAPKPAVQPLTPPPLAPQLIAAPSTAPLPADAFTVPAPPPTPVVTPVAAPTPVAATAAVAVPPPRKVVAATAVEYLVQPPAELPRASRRAGEHGTVLVRVIVDTRGLPAWVGIQRGSGYARLDENALAAMRQARFKPYTENGTALEVEVVAPIEYPQE